MAFCSACDQSNVELLGGIELRWECPQCHLVADATDDQTLLAFENVTQSNAGDPSLYATMIEHAGGDPVATKVRRVCPKCKTSQLMSRLFLGDSESAFDVCPGCHGYSPSE